MSIIEIVYLIVHGIATLGILMAFFIRIEHRLTRVETKMENFEKRFTR